MLSYIKTHKKAFITFIGLMVAVVTAATLGIYFVAIKSEKTPIAIDENGNELISGKVYDMPSNLMFTSDVEETADNDGIILKATVKPDVAYNKTLDWTVAFSGSDSWATGKQATDYVTVTPTADGSDTATVKCLQPFGQAIEIQVTARSNPNAKASCNLDYMKRVSASGLVFDFTEQYPYVGKLVIPTGGGEIMLPALDSLTEAEYRYNMYLSTNFDNVAYQSQMGIGTVEPSTKFSLIVYVRFLPNVSTALTNAGFMNTPTDFVRVTPAQESSFTNELHMYNILGGLFPYTKQPDYVKNSLITESQFYKPYGVLKDISGDQFEMKFEYTNNGFTQSVIHKYRFSTASDLYKVESVSIDNSTVVF